VPIAGNVTITPRQLHLILTRCIDRLTLKQRSWFEYRLPLKKINRERLHLLTNYNGVWSQQFIERSVYLLESDR